MNERTNVRRLTMTVAAWHSSNIVGCINEYVGLPQYFTEPPRPTQPPILSGTGNEYQPKCGDAVRLESKGRYGSVLLWINVWVAGNR